MYGTVARLQVKPGMESKLKEVSRTAEEAHIPGHVATYVYRMDSNPNEYYLAVIFTSKETYQANAESPEQDARYREMLALLGQEPAWHDGEVIYAGVYTGQVGGASAG